MCLSKALCLTTHAHFPPSPRPLHYVALRNKTFLILSPFCFSALQASGTAPQLGPSPPPCRHLYMAFELLFVLSTLYIVRDCVQCNYGEQGLQKWLQGAPTGERE